MRKLRQTTLALLTILALVLTPTGALFAETDAPEVAPPLYLTAGVFVPGQAPLPLDPDLTITGYAPGEAGYYIVQFRGPVQAAWKAALTATGAQLLNYLPKYAFKVRMTPEQAAQVAAQSAVGWVGLFQPAYKLSLDLPTSPAIYAVEVEQGADVAAVFNAIKAAGMPVYRQGNSRVLLVAATPAQQVTLARIRDVAWIETYTPNRPHNESAAGVILGGNTANAKGYDGSTQIVAVADTGLGDGTAAGAHPDIPAARVVDVFNWPGEPDGICSVEIADDGAKDVDSGHGTHVAASVVSDGGDGGVGKAAAPAAKLVFQAVENYATFTPLCALIFGADAGYVLSGLPTDLGELFQEAYTAGARIHANSWGASVAGEYTENSAEADNFIWSHPDMAITFSAGNSGADENGDGVVDEQSLGSPASAKNVIAIGASENARADGFPCDTTLTYASHDGSQEGKTCGQMGGKNTLGTYSVYGFDAEPLKSDPRAGNAEQLAAFSSRGPTMDGRIKPDVVAPGTWILSGYASLFQEGYGDPLNPQVNAPQYDGWGLPFNVDYKYLGGTSMSNPIAAGAATVVRDYYQKEYNVAASAALVKATLINSAVDLLDENNDGADDNDFPIPNMHEGWGRINLANATDGSSQFADGGDGLQTGETASAGYTVATAGATFKVTLVWSDYPGDPTAARNLVNNLDLVVTAPSGKMYLGNVFEGGWSITGGAADEINNVENVYIESAEAGEWQVEVKGLNVPQGPQPFALVIDGGEINTAQPQITAVTPDNGDAGTVVQVTITGANTNFAAGVTELEFGEGFEIAEVTVTSPTEVSAKLTIDADADAGVRDVTVVTGNEVVRKQAGFTVNAGATTPALLSVTPDNGTPGDLLDVTIEGANTNFVTGRTDADFGAGVVISTVTVISPTQVVVNLQVEAGAEPGQRTVTLTTGAEVVRKTDGFRVNVDSQTPGATLYVDPTPATMQVNATGTLEIVLSPGSTPINGVQIHGQVDPTVLKLVDVTAGASQLSEVLDPITFDPATGVFRFGAGILGQTVIEPFVVLTLEVQALKATAASGTPVTFLNTFPATDISGPSGSVMEAARDGLVIVESTGATAELHGRVDLQGRPAKPALSWSAPITVELLPASGAQIVERVTTDQNGEFIIGNLAAGVYTIRVKGDHTLANRIEQVELKSGVNSIFLGTLFEGDVEVNTSGNQTVIADFGQLSGAFDKCAGDAGYVHNADLDEADDCITITDYGLLSPNFNKQGDLTFNNPTRVPAPLPLAQPNAVLAFEQANIYANVGSAVDLRLDVDPRDGDSVVGVTVRYRFDPAKLEVVKITLAQNWTSRVLALPVIDNTQGTIYFAVGAELGQSLQERVPVATVQVKLKTASGAQLAPVVGGPRDTNIAGVNGSVMAGAETIESLSGVSLFDATQLPNRAFMPVVKR